MQISDFALIKGLHDLFSAIWVGGLIVLGFVMIPVSKEVLGMSPQFKTLLLSLHKRLSIFIFASMGGLIVTGMLEARRSPSFDGIFNFGSPYSTLLAVKHILVIAMIVVALCRSFVLRRQSGDSAGQAKLGGILLYLNILLGVAVLLLSGAVGAL